MASLWSLTINVTFFLLLKPPNSNQSWDAFFKNTDKGAPPGQAYQSPPQGGGIAPAAYVPPAQATTQGAMDTRIIDDHLAVQAVIRSYQVLYSFAFKLTSRYPLAAVPVTFYKSTIKRIIL